jgi:hypothetical protein
VKEACVNCKFHQMNAQDMKMILCRRYPPTIFAIPQGPGQMGQLIMHPQLPTGFWCGEYRPSQQLVDVGIAK